MSEQPRSGFDIAADLLLYAPVGLALQLSEHLPQLAASGRSRLRGPVAAARIVGHFAVQQGRRDLGGRLRQATEPYFGGASQPQTAPSGTTTGPTATPGPSAEPATESSGPAAADAAKAEGVPMVDDLAVPGYATLSASQVLAHLQRLSPAELAAVAAYENGHRARKTVLARIAQMQSR